MTPPTTAELHALREIAERATPGEWVADDGNFGGIRAEVYHGRRCKGEPLDDGLECFPCICVVDEWPQDRWDFLGPGESLANRAHIAAFNPATVIRLIDALLAERNPPPTPGE